MLFDNRRSKGFNESHIHKFLVGNDAVVLFLAVEPTGSGGQYTQVQINTQLWPISWHQLSQRSLIENNSAFCLYLRKCFLVLLSPTAVQSFTGVFDIRIVDRSTIAPLSERERMEMDEMRERERRERAEIYRQENRELVRWSNLVVPIHSIDSLCHPFSRRGVLTVDPPWFQDGTTEPNHHPPPTNTSE